MHLVKLSYLSKLPKVNKDLANVTRKSVLNYLNHFPFQFVEKETHWSIASCSYGFL